VKGACSEIGTHSEWINFIYGGVVTFFLLIDVCMSADISQLA
jgi:hypothetical protein